MNLTNLLFRSGCKVDLLGCDGRTEKIEKEFVFEKNEQIRIITNKAEVLINLIPNE